MGISPIRQISALAADREAHERILQFVQAALEDLSQPSQTVKMQADESYQAVFQRLGQDEYDLTDLVKCLGDFDPVDLNRNFAALSASRFIRDTIVDGYTIPFIYTPLSAHFTNNRSAIVDSDFGFWKAAGLQGSLFVGWATDGI